METTSAKRGVRPLGIGVGWLLMGATLWAQDTDSPLETFQRFVNGKVPVKDAVVYRRLTKPDGTLMNEEWMRFGYQDKTMFVFRLTRDTNNASQLISLPRPETFGASFDQVWTISDRTLHVADKEFAFGSVPDTAGAFPRSLVINSLALGIPCLENTNIQWSGSNFTSKILIHRDITGIANETVSVKGRLLLGADGIPTGAEYSGSANSNDRSVAYEYEPSQRGIPVA